MTGASRKAIRLYEEMGLLGEIKRRGGYRFFDKTTVDRIRIIKIAQSFGFSLKEIKKLLVETDSCEDFPWQLAGRLVEEKKQVITEEITRLKEAKHQLDRLHLELENRNCNSL